nr:AAA family ATPase [bacterium]
MNPEIQEINEQVREASSFIAPLRSEMGKVIVGQQYLIDRLLIGLLANGHILIEGVPGLAKSLSVQVLARAIDTSFQRIQFTPDLLPADLIGTRIYSPKSGEFSTRKGPIFSNLILADEINRAPAKVQSALLEAMQERQVTIGVETFPLAEPFMVLATQNPIEQEGTYPLPEAQVDRFMFKLVISYPDKKEEREIMERMAVTDYELSVAAVVEPETVLAARRVLDRIYVDDKVKSYILDIVFATRAPSDYGLDIGDYIRYG